MKGQTSFGKGSWGSRRAQLAADKRVEGELPLLADLLAAVIRAGATPEAAARFVGRAVDGPAGERLRKVEISLRLGVNIEEAWGLLGRTDAVRMLARLAARSAHSGAAFAGALERLADDLRADRLIASEAAVQRAAVFIVLPLGLCFLPAFVLTGVVPVIVTVLGDVLSP